MQLQGAGRCLDSPPPIAEITRAGGGDGRGLFRLRAGDLQFPEARLRVDNAAKGEVRQPGHQQFGGGANQGAFQEMAAGHPAIRIGHAEVLVGPIEAQAAGQAEDLVIARKRGGTIAAGEAQPHRRQAADAADQHAGPLAPLEGQAGQDEQQIAAGGEAERFELHGSQAGEGIGLPSIAKAALRHFAGDVCRIDERFALVEAIDSEANARQARLLLHIAPSHPHPDDQRFLS